MAAANTTNSPRHVITENLLSPTAAQSRRASRPVSSPWTQIVRGESDPIVAASATPPSPQSNTSSGSSPVEEEKSESAGGNAGKKPAWNRPSNGAAAAAAAAGAEVMGAASWPALSETTKAPSNKSSSDSLKSLADGSSSSSSSSSSSLSSFIPVVSQGTGIASVSTQKQVSSNTNSHSTPNYPRQKSFKRNGGSASSNGSLTHPSSQGSVADGHSHNPSPRGHGQRNGFVSQSHGGNDNQQQRNSFRNQNGNHHQNHGGRRNQDHGNHNWNHHRNSFNGRDGHMQPPRVVPGFVRHPTSHISGPFIQTPPIQPFGSPMGFPELASPVYYPPPQHLRGVPLVAPMPAAFFYPLPDPLLYSNIVNQIHFYFSDENLIKDLFLRKRMDDQGWVPIQLIAGFKRVSELTDNIQLIVELLQGSPVVEVQGDKIRRRNDWKKWLLPPTVRFPDVPSPRTLEGSEPDKLATNVQNAHLEASVSGSPSGDSNTLLQPSSNAAAGSASRSSSSDSNTQSQQSTDAAAGPVTSRSTSPLKSN